MERGKLSLLFEEEFYIDLMFFTFNQKTGDFKLTIWRCDLSVVSFLCERHIAEVKYGGHGAQDITLLGVSETHHTHGCNNKILSQYTP